MTAIRNETDPVAAADAMVQACDEFTEKPQSWKRR